MKHRVYELEYKKYTLMIQYYGNGKRWFVDISGNITSFRHYEYKSYTWTLKRIRKELEIAINQGYEITKRYRI